MSNIQQLVDRRILERFSPPGVVINENFEILQFRGRTGPYFEPLPGAASLHLLKLARPELVAELRIAVHQAFESNAPARSPRLWVKNNGEGRFVEIEALPIADPESKGRCVAVLFVDVPAEGGSPTEEAAKPMVTGLTPDAQVAQLERELGATKEYLQTTIEELETSNEELKSANEELQSANEDLQSTNEELETSKEELQSTNEELATVNDELHSRMLELGQSNDDLHNLLALVETAIVIVGLDLRIRRFSQSAEKLLNLIPGDAGRPVAHLAWFVPSVPFERVAADVIQSITPRHDRVTASNGRRYRLGIVPYKTADHAIKGVVLTFADDGAAVKGPDSSAPPNAAR